MAKMQEFCKYGHLLAETRKYYYNETARLYKTYCSICSNNKAKKYNARNKDKKKLYQKEYDLKIKYNMTISEFIELQAEQNKQCKICLKSNCKLVIDHCHKSGKVRSLLCNNCNTALGLLNEDLQIVISLQKYIKENKNA